MATKVFVVYVRDKLFMISEDFDKCILYLTIHFEEIYYRGIDLNSDRHYYTMYQYDLDTLNHYTECKLNVRGMGIDDVHLFKYMIVDCHGQPMFVGRLIHCQYYLKKILMHDSANGYSLRIIKDSGSIDTKLYSAAELIKNNKNYYVMHDDKECISCVASSESVCKELIKDLPDYNDLVENDDIPDIYEYESGVVLCSIDDDIPDIESLKL